MSNVLVRGTIILQLVVCIKCIAFWSNASGSRVSRRAKLESALGCHVQVHDLSRGSRDVRGCVDTRLLEFTNAIFCSTIWLSVDP